jgi:hypothetical protein
MGALYSRRLRVFHVVYVKRQIPVINYSMGKVGSTSVHASIPASIPHFQIHTMDPDRIASRRREKNANTLQHHHADQLRRHVAERDHPAKYIVMVRNPIDRNLSTFFERFKYYAGTEFTHSTRSLEELIQVFHARFEHDRPLRWFDDELERYLGFRVYRYPFPREQGHARFRHRNADILVMKVELPDTVKESALAAFLDCPEFRLTSRNLAEDKDYATTYAAFKKQLVLGEDYVAWMLDSAYTRHFYTPDEIEICRRRWLARLEAVSAR